MRSSTSTAKSRRGEDDEDQAESAFEYEFYVRDVEAQLWEIKFDATDGTATELEPKGMVDP